MNTTDLPPLPPVKTERKVIPVALIHPSPLNPRMVAKKDRASLESSLRAQGQLVALWLRPHKEKAGEFELVDGERRWWGMQAAGITEAVADVGDFTDPHILRITWTTGTEGKRLTALEEGRWAAGAMKSMPGATLESIGKLVGVVASTLHTRLALLELPDFAQEALQSGKLPATTAYLIATVPGPARIDFARQVITPEDEKGPLSFDAADALRRANYSRTLKGAPFDTEDAELLPGAGACKTCRFRAGNNREEYGEVKNPHTCMHTACFADKEAASRARVAAKEAGKIALSREENAIVFAGGAAEPAPESGYVVATRPIPADLVKAEVAAQGAPSFAEVSPTARIFVGTSGAGVVVDLVKVDEAIAATREPDIFKPAIVAQHSLKDNRGSHHETSDGERVETPAVADVVAPKAEPVAGSIAADQKKRRTAETAAAKALAKKLRECSEWLAELVGALVKPDKPSGYAYTRASLRWEHVLRSVPDEDALLVLRAVSSEAPAKGESAKSALAEFVSGIGGAVELDAIVDALDLASALRAQGVEAPWVKDWHQHLVVPLSAKGEPEVAPAKPAAPPMEAAEQDKLTAIAKADADGMPIAEISRSFGVPEAELYGMLQKPAPDHLIKEARQRVDDLFAECGTTAPAAKDAMAKLACKCRLSEIKTLDQWVALAAQLKRIADSRARRGGEPAAAKEGGE